VAGARADPQLGAGDATLEPVRVRERNPSIRLAPLNEDRQLRLAQPIRQQRRTRDPLQHRGEGLGVPVRSLTADEAQAHFDWLAPFVVLDNPTSSALTRKSLGWRPREPELLTDMRDGGYFSDVNRLAARG
jgi:hypothetical protein